MLNQGFHYISYLETSYEGREKLLSCLPLLALLATRRVLTSNICASMIKITLHSEIMDGNESITIYESSETSDRVLEVGVYAGAAITTCLGSIAITGLIIKGVFIYYIKYAAPKERPINNMVLYDQVSNKLKRTRTNVFFEKKKKNG